MIDNPALLPKVRSRALLDAIRDMPCALRISSFIPGHRCSGQDTVVPCHLPGIGKSMGSKVSDLFVVAGCFHCHQLLDGRDANQSVLIDRYAAAVTERMLRALMETQSRWVAAGLLTGEGWEVV